MGIEILSVWNNLKLCLLKIYRHFILHVYTEVLTNILEDKTSSSSGTDPSWKVTDFLLVFPVEWFYTSHLFGPFIACCSVWAKAQYWRPYFDLYILVYFFKFWLWWRVVSLAFLPDLLIFDDTFYINCIVKYLYGSRRINPEIIIRPYIKPLLYFPNLCRSLFYKIGTFYLFMLIRCVVYMYMVKLPIKYQSVYIQHIMIRVNTSKKSRINTWCQI